MRVLSILEESVVDGPGVRTVIFTAGCPHRCPGCHNPESWNPKGGKEMSVEALLRVVETSAWDGVTISGGEPFLQSGELLRVVRGCKALGKNVWIYTGYTLEALQQLKNEEINTVLNDADVLVDGRFEQPLMDRSLRFRGSSNQRIIFLNKA